VFPVAWPLLPSFWADALSFFAEVKESGTVLSAEVGTT